MVSREAASLSAAAGIDLGLPLIDLAVVDLVPFGGARKCSASIAYSVPMFADVLPLVNPVSPLRKFIFSTAIIVCFVRLSNLQ